MFFHWYNTNRMSVQNIAQLTYGSTIQWVSGVPFNGYVLLLAALPSKTGTAYQSVFLRDCQPKTEVPKRIKIPIREGVYDTDVRVWRTDSLVPTLVRYCAFFYDDSDRLIANGASLFTITADPHTLTPPTLTDPDVASSCPTPEAVTILVPSISASQAKREDLGGVKNGVNTAFTITVTGSVVMVIWNGLILDEDVGYTRSGTAITMAAGYIPGATDSLECLIFP